MKKIITTVGTSLIDNYMKTRKKFPKDVYIKKNRLEIDDKDANHYAAKLYKWVTEDKANAASAEITSIEKIKKECGDDLDVYLLASDTALSYICSLAIKKSYNDVNGIKIKEISVISGLRVNSKNKFVKEGLPSLISRIDNIANGYFSNVIFNITGGYKGVVPYLTIMALINQSEIKYIYEDSKELITIPILPIIINDEIFEKYFDELSLLNIGIENYQNVKCENYEIYNNLEKIGLVESQDNLALISPIGKIFFENFNSRYLSFYCPDDVFQEIENQKDIKRILKEKFITSITDKKLKKKGNHYVFDDGNNNNRIYFFKSHGKVYIYKTFQNEELAKKYIDVNVNHEDIIKKSKYRRVKK